jgi:hypothetical protein
VPGLPGGNSLFFASPKKSKQKKGDPQSGPLRGSLKYSNETENLETSRQAAVEHLNLLIRLV